MSIPAAGEFAAIERLRRLLPVPPPGEVWIGDDAAVVGSASGPLLLAADVLVEGVHVDLSLVGLDDFGWKAVAVNVSDIAAMGGYPMHALVTVAGPPTVDLDLLYAGIVEAAAAWGCAVVGGDLSSAPVLSVSVALTGTTDGEPVLRSGARPGDTVFVTGPLGASAAGLRELRAGRRSGALVQAHRRPSPPVRAGQLARAAGASAMIDVSDGLGADLGHLAAASGVGVVLHQVPVADGATLEEAMGGGEDYQLVFTVGDPARVEAAFEGAARPFPIGVCTADPTERPPATGWEHPWS
jgi:thiamine-monophosphate kinase